MTMSRPPAAFLDLDGVILDVSERQYQVHRSLLRDLGLGGEPAIDRSAFWEMKRDRRPARELLEASGFEAADEAAYRRGWLERVESSDFLGLDTPIDGAVEALESLRRRGPLVLVTLRQRPDHLALELERLGLRPFFDEVLTASPRGEEGWRVKADLLSAGGARPGLTIVGDTEVDIRAGKALGLRTVAVTSGIRNRALLEAEGPDQVLESLRDFARTLSPASTP
jgi:phosphoglycolate phosphatase